MAIEQHPELVLAIDIGATSIKMADVTFGGDIVGSIRRRSTPYPCTPQRLTQWLHARIAYRAATHVGIGFPGDFHDGKVRTPGNLARSHGAGTPVVPKIAAQWEGFALREALNRIEGVDVRIVNDARLAALGSIRGVGRELVVTLGTGFGVSLAVDGSFQTIPDFGQQLFAEGHTYDEALGERARATDLTTWKRSVRRVVDELQRRWDVEHVHVGGGNAQRLRTDEITTDGARVTIQGNRAALRGAARLFTVREGREFGE